MKTIKIRKAVSRIGLKHLDNAIEKAYGFLYARYGNQFDDVDLLIVPETTRGRYCPDQKLAKIPVERFWTTYNKKTIGVSASRIPVGYELGTALVIVHELTHHVQGREGRRYSEVETTQNEIDFMNQVDKDWNKYLKQI